MKKLFIQLVALPCAVFAARVEVTPVQMPQDIVTEVVATNFAFNVDCDSLRGIELRFLLDGCASNCLQVAFGRDEDGNGVLDVEEMETLYGWRNGRYFAESMKDGIRIEEAAASFQMSRSFAVNLEMKKGVGLHEFSATNETGTAILTNLSVTAQSWLYSPDCPRQRRPLSGDRRRLHHPRRSGCGQPDHRLRVRPHGQNDGSHQEGR